MSAKSLNISSSSKTASGELRLFAQRLVKRAINAGPVITFAIAAGLCGLAGYWAYGTFLTPQTEENAKSAARVSALKRENTANLAVQRTKPQFIAEFRQLLDHHDNARQLLPEEVEVSNVLAAVQQMAAKNGVRITRFNSTTAGAKSSAADYLYERAVPTTVIGGHGAVVRFLIDLARYPRVIHVRDLAITSLKKTESVDFTLVTFYSPPSLPPVPAELLAERRGHSGNQAALKNAEEVLSQ